MMHCVIITSPSKFQSKDASGLYLQKDFSMLIKDIQSSSMLEKKADSNTSLQTLKDAMQTFVDERAWNEFHNPKNLAASVSIEAAELLEQFQWLTLPESMEKALSDESFRGEVSDELADVFLYLLALANVMQLDISEAVLKKLEKNRIKYPVGKFYGDYRGK